MLDCPRKWWFAYNQRLQPLKPSSKLDLGKIVHDLIETFLRNRSITQDEIRSLIEEKVKQSIDEHAANGGFPYQDSEIQEIKDLSDSMMRKFIEFSKKNDDFEVVSLEEEFDIPIINPTTGKTHEGLRLMGKIDGWVKINGHNFILEHKTAVSCEGDYWWKNLTQVDFYTYAISRKHNITFKGAVLNYLIKRIPTVPELLKSGKLSTDKRIITTEEIYMSEIARHNLNPADYKEVLDRIRERGNQFVVRKIVSRIPDDLAEIENTIWWVANRKLKMAHFPKNRSDQCSWKCGFKELCIDDMPETREALYRIKDSEHQELKGNSNVIEV